MKGRLLAYEWNAREYSKLDLPHLRWGNDLLSKLEVRSDSSILEIGCGTGRDTEKLASRVPMGRVIAVDKSESMLEVARSHLSAYYTNIEFRRADILEGLSDSNFCDAAFSVATLHWVGDHQLAFSNIATALRRGGVFLSDCGGKGNCDAVYDAARSVLGPSGADRFVHFEDSSSTENRLAAAGFERAEVRLVNDPIKFQSVEVLESFLATMILGAHLEKISRDSRAEALRDIIQRIPGMTVDYVRLRIRAAKS